MITDAQVEAALSAWMDSTGSLHNGMRAALEAAERAAWQPIEEAPKVADQVILATRIGRNPWGVPALLVWLDGPSLLLGPGWYSFERATTPKRPTHFRPLPEGV